ncbi:MAG: gamma-glutamyltransferase, partial [Methyloceanibacter sp.]
MTKTKGVVAAGHELTVSAAAEILEDGGNAFDAALAGAFMTFVAEAVFASPGGGGFLMARQAGKAKAALFDFFVETPLQKRASAAFFPLHADFGPAKQEFHIGQGSSATPGAIPGLFAIHEALCRLPMKRLAEPAARAARKGFPLSPFQAYLFTVIAPILTASEGVARIFAPGGKPMAAGETFRNEKLADCLEWAAEDGPRLFADGDVGRAIVAGQNSGGGHLTHADLARYRVALRDPLTWKHRGATVALNPPPAASGALIAFGLAYLDAAVRAGGAIDALQLRDAMAAINQARAAHGEDLARRLVGGEPVQELGKARRHAASYRGTTHVSVIDAEGNAAAVSLSNGEGNGFIVGDFGFMLNN